MRLKPPLQLHAVRLRGLLVAGDVGIAPTIVATPLSNGTTHRDKQARSMSAKADSVLL